jgi:DNA polymerase III gamma/tau subunit
VLNFKEIGIAELSNYVRKVAQEQGVKIESDIVITKVAKAARGSARDCLTILDQLLTFDDALISEDSLSQAIGLVKLSSLEELLGYVLQGDMYNLSKLYRALISDNVEINNLVSELSGLIYEIIQIKLKINTNDRLEKLLNYEVSEYIFILENLTRDFSWIVNSISPDRLLEVLLQKLALRGNYLGHPKNKSNKSSGEQSSDENVSLASYISGRDNILALNLEQSSRTEEHGGNFKIYFPVAATLFYERLSERKDKLEQLFSDFYKRDVKIELILEKSEEKIAEENVLENPLVIRAEGLFNSQADKIIEGEAPQKGGDYSDR